MAISLSVIFGVLLACSIKPSAADHLEPGIGIFENENEVNVISTKDSNYEIYLTMEVRNEQGQLVSISESTHGKHIAHEITDFVFNEKLGEKEIVIANNIEYEKRQFTANPNIESHLDAFFGLWHFSFCGDIGGHIDVCVPIFQTNTAPTYIEEGDTIKNQWTILRIIN